VPPEFCNDELLESCSLLATLLLYRLISQADDQGRLPGAPKYVRAICFGMRPEISERKVAAATDELVRAGFVIRYDLKGRVFLQIDKWHDLQGKWGRRAYASRYPAPPGWADDWVSVKSDEPEPPEVRAPSAQGARDLHPPTPIPLSVPLPFPSSGLRRPPARGGGMERLGDLIERAKRGRLTDEEALEMGMALAEHGRTPKRATR
jgi:hypothetical protein